MRKGYVLKYYRNKGISKYNEYLKYLSIHWWSEDVWGEEGGGILTIW